MSMNKDEAKKEVSSILGKILAYNPVYWHENTYIRWGRVEIDLRKIIDDMDRKTGPLRGQDQSDDTESIRVKEGEDV